MNSVLRSDTDLGLETLGYRKKSSTSLSAKAVNGYDSFKAAASLLSFHIARNLFEKAENERADGDEPQDDNQQVWHYFKLLQQRGAKLANQ